MATLQSKSGKPWLGIQVSDNTCKLERAELRLKEKEHKLKGCGRAPGRPRRMEVTALLTEETFRVEFNGTNDVESF